MIPGIRGIAWVMMGFLVAGCDRGPRAPLLRDEAIYHDRRLGLRFVVPEGWKIQARSDMPPGPMKKERILAEYARLTSVPAMMRLSAVDYPASEPIKIRAEKGRSYKEPKIETDITVGGIPAERHQFTPTTPGDSKEVVAVRRGERVFYFTGVYPPGDREAKSAFRKAVESIVWE